MIEIKLNEKEIKELIVSNLREKIATRYTFSVVDQIVDDVMREEESHKKLEKFVRQTLAFVQGDKVFEKSVKEEFQRKVAKSLVGKLEGTVERAVDKIRQNETLRAEMLLAIERIVQKDSKA